MWGLNLLAEEAYKGAPNIFWGIFTFVLGMVVVFLGMALLVLFISLVAKVMTAKKQPVSNGDLDEDEQEPELENVVAAESDDDVPEHVKVAIIAAVLAYYQGEGVKNEFVVKKIKKLNY